MSTSYYYLKEPFTSATMYEDGAHATIMLEVRGVPAGSLRVLKDLVPDVLYALAEPAYDNRVPMRTGFGGANAGCVVTENVRGLDPSLVLVSEYGELFTVAEIRAMAGRGKVAP